MKWEREAAEEASMMTYQEAETFTRTVGLDGERDEASPIELACDRAWLRVRHGEDWACLQRVENATAILLKDNGQ